MPHYEYVGIDDLGKKVQGELEASGEKDLENKLNQMGYYLLQVIEKGHKSTHTGKAAPPGFWVPPMIGCIGLSCIVEGVFDPFASASLPNGKLSIAMFPCGLGLFVLILCSINFLLLAFTRRYLTTLIPYVISAILTFLNVFPFVIVTSYKSTLTDKSVIKSLERTKPKEEVEQLRQMVGGMRTERGLWFLTAGHVLVLVAIVSGRLSRRSY